MKIIAKNVSIYLTEEEYESGDFLQVFDEYLLAATLNGGSVRMYDHHLQVVGWYDEGSDMFYLDRTYFYVDGETIAEDMDWDRHTYSLCSKL